MTHDEAVTKIYTLNDPNQAEILKNLLLGHNIDCVLDGEHQAGFTGILEIDVLVKADDAEEALRILRRTTLMNHSMKSDSTHMPAGWDGRHARQYNSA